MEVLPVVGGAVEELECPDFEEREDQALNEEEKVFETIFERNPSGAWPPRYRSVPPLGQIQAHLFRYFLDGSFCFYFLGTVLEHERESPVHFAQIEACVLHREDDGLVRRKHLQGGQGVAFRCPLGEVREHRRSVAEIGRSHRRGHRQPRFIGF